jgi:hypothetical protein
MPKSELRTTGRGKVATEMLGLDALGRWDALQPGIRVHAQQRNMLTPAYCDKLPKLSVRETDRAQNLCLGGTKLYSLAHLGRRELRSTVLRQPALQHFVSGGWKKSGLHHRADKILKLLQKHFFKQVVGPSLVVLSLPPDRSIIPSTP